MFRYVGAIKGAVVVATVVMNSVVALVMTSEGAVVDAFGIDVREIAVVMTVEVRAGRVVESRVVERTIVVGANGEDSPLPDSSEEDVGMCGDVVGVTLWGGVVIAVVHVVLVEGVVTVMLLG